MRLIFSFLVIALLVLAGCGGKESNQNPSSAGGKIYGQAWKYAGAEARPSPSHVGKFFIHLFDATDHKPCDFFMGTQMGVDFEVPAQAGDYDVSSDQPFLLMFSKTSLNSAQSTSTESGSVHISAVNTDAIQGSVTAANEPDFSISTSFNAKICH